MLRRESLHCPYSSTSPNVEDPLRIGAERATVQLIIVHHEHHLMALR